MKYKYIIPVLLFVAFIYGLCASLNKAIDGFWWNPLTDFGFHTVVTTTRISENVWNHNKEIYIEGAVWHNIDIMSQRQVGYCHLVYNVKDEPYFNRIIDSIKSNYRHLGDSIIKTVQ